MRTFLAIVLLFAASSHSVAHKPQPQSGHTNEILVVRFSPDDAQLISYSAGDGRLILWDVETGNLRWMAKTEFIQKADEKFNLEAFWWNEDGRSILTKSENGT
jgi:WD40 repeat protein